jgi:KDO2-lipid IV(A) lauroyltransferase
MAKPRSHVTDYLVYLVVRFFVCVVQALPLKVAYRLADGLSWVLYKVDRRHRLIADDNLKQAYPGVYTDAERDHLVRGVYRHFCRMIMEMILLPRFFHVHNWKDYLRCEGAEKWLGSLLSDRPVMIVTGHLGNWELAGYALGLFGFHSYAIARPIDNPYLDRFLRRFRERTGQQILAKRGEFDDLQAILQQGGIVATLGDQDAGRRGLFVPFFGRPASTHKAIALLSMEYNVPLLVIATIKVGDAMQYDIVAEDLIFPEEYAGRPDAIRAITERFTEAFERLVRRAPEQYLWLHRRWKHQPKAREKKAA